MEIMPSAYDLYFDNILIKTWKIYKYIVTLCQETLLTAFLTFNIILYKNNKTIILQVYSDK